MPIQNEEEVGQLKNLGMALITAVVQSGAKRLVAGADAPDTIQELQTQAAVELTGFIEAHAGDLIALTPSALLTWGGELLGVAGFDPERYKGSLGSATFEDLAGRAEARAEEIDANTAAFVEVPAQVLRDSYEMLGHVARKALGLALLAVMG